MKRLSDVIDSLPVLGVGASLSFGVNPDPVALARTRGGPSFIEYAGAVQHEFMKPSLDALMRDGVPLLYHPSCLNLCSTIKNPKPWLDAVARHVDAVKSPWLAQDVAICFRGDTGGYSIQLGYFVPPILTKASLEHAVERVEEVLAVVDAPLLLEPAPVTFALGDMDIFEWLGALAERTDCGLLIDAGHIVSHQLARGADNITDGLERLDLERVIEIHVAGGVIKEDPGSKRRVYVDAHDLPVLPETWMVLRTLLDGATNLRAVCVECEGSLAASILPLLQLTRERVRHGSGNPALVDAVQRELEGVAA